MDTTPTPQYRINDELAFTWIGHGTWLIRTATGKRLLIDPWVTENPAAPEHVKTIDRIDLMAITHGHVDHVSDAADLATAHRPTVLCPMELGKWLVRQGVDEGSVVGFNKGGTVQRHGITFTMVHAEHSSSTPDGTYTGNPVGYVITFENGFRAYFSGDTDVFGDMALIRELEAPDVAFIPIGDFYTMGPRRAAKAVELLGVKTVVPQHYGTREMHTGRPHQLRALVASDVTVVEARPGQTI